MTKQRIKDLKKAIEYLDRINQWVNEADKDKQTEDEYLLSLVKVEQNCTHSKELLESIVSEA